MILWVWSMRRLTSWVVGACVLTCALLFAVEGIEQAGNGGGWWASLQIRMPLVLRDLLGLTLVFAAGGLALRLRHRDVPGFSTAGVSPARLARVLLAVLVFWNLLLGSALEWWVHQRSDPPGTGWLHGETSSLFVSNEGSDPSVAWGLVHEDGAWTRTKQQISQDELNGLWLSRRPAERSLTQLGSLESRVSQAWWHWRALNLVLPALLAGFAVWFAFQTRLGAGWTLGLPLGLALSTQVLGSMGAQAGQGPW